MMKSSKLLIFFLMVLVMSGCGGGSGSSPPALVAIAVTPADPAVARGTTQQFTAMGTYSNKSTQDLSASVTWTSTNTGAATISATGLATAIATGSTTITASTGGVSGSTILTVTNAALVSIAVTPANQTIAVGTAQQFSATGSLSGSTPQDLTTAVIWSSSNSRVATINTVGLATSHAAGTSTITATSGIISGSTTLTVSVPAGGNTLPITVNGSLCSSAFNASYPNKPCVSVTVCTPGTATCQTINDILLDTGSYGLRIFNQALTVPLTQVTVPSGNLATCAQFGDLSSDWGPVQSADIILGGEPAVRVPIQVINAGFGTVPAGCVQTGGSLDRSPADAQFNGILGVGLFAEDCGSGCVNSTSNGVYFACTGTSCSGSTAPLASQVQNPVALLPPPDNNGVLVQLPSVPLIGAASVNGQLVLGINTQANNVPSGVTAYPASPSTGNFITVFNGTTFSNSFIDSGSNGRFFSDSSLPVCSGSWYCPPTIQSLSAITEGFTGTPSASVPFQIGNATSLFSSGNNVFIQLGGSLPALGGFDWGLPFFLGRSVFVGIDGRTATGLGTGPFWAY
jgi:hypothetical protein